VADSSSSEFTDPLIEKTVQKSVPAGIHPLSFSDIQQDFNLEKNVEYQWTMVIPCHPDSPSLDVKATGTIMRVDPPVALKNVENTGSKKDLAQFYAENGIWYNAIDMLSTHIQNQPELRTLRADLLEQAGLKKVATAEKR
jgi:hypothetical protein